MLDITGLSKRYAGFEFGPLTLSVGAEVLSVLGPSGSGKTTLLSLIAGTVEPRAGSVSLDGRSLGGVPIEKRGVGVVFQDGALFPHMTARENIGYAAAEAGRIEELAAAFEITDLLDRRPPTLSGGEKQRVALARTLAADPDALVLDEPLSSLDAPIRRRLRGELHALFDSLEIPVVYVTHDQRTATALGDRLAIVRDGTLEQVGPPSAVLDRPATRFVATFTGNENVLDATVTDWNGETATLRVGDASLRTTERVATGSTVTVCVHPSRLRLRNGDSDAIGGNTVTGTIDGWLHEGTEYRVEVALDDAVSLTVTVQPGEFERVRTATDAVVAVTVPPEAVHVLRATDPSV